MRWGLLLRTPLNQLCYTGNVFVPLSTPLFACSACAGSYLMYANAFLPSWVVLMGLWVALDGALRPNGKLRVAECVFVITTLFMTTSMSRWPLIFAAGVWWSVYFIRAWRRIGRKDRLPWEKKLAWLDHLTSLAMVAALFIYDGVGHHTLWWLRTLV